MKKQLIKDIQAGDAINSQFAIISVTLKSYSKGFKLDFEFGDNSGTIDGVLWDCAPDEHKKYSPGEIVTVQGVVNVYQNELQLNVSSVESVEGDYDIKEFLKSSHFNVDKMWEKLQDKIASISNEYLVLLLNSFFSDEAFVEKFILAPGGKKWHHGFLGGLLQHTLYMTQIADFVSGIYPKCDRDLLLTGAILHDIGKVYELDVGGAINYSTRGRLEGHISIGYHEVSAAVSKIEDFPEGLAAEVKHLILSHQGELANGSPVVPMTLEAVILHQVDMLDSQVEAYSNIIDKQAPDGAEWSEYIRLKERFFYFGEKYNGS
ncbi:MAG: HD domain-containing protein [candidate division Zixibacteria bacterium]|nr:HD domain-containing protein [candidate division Zixibacteria bacterium]